MVTDFLWAVYGLTRAYPGVFVGAFLVGFVLAWAGALRIAVAWFLARRSSERP